MIATSIIVGLAFIWLGYETDWLTIRLLIGTILDDDYEPGYDGSDYEFLDDYEGQLAEAKTSYADDLAYQEWLTNLYTPKPRYYKPATEAPQTIQERIYSQAHKADNLIHFGHGSIISHGRYGNYLRGLR